MVGNFKAFADTQKIKIKPITLIFGANSAGKSSLLHALLLLNHASQRRDSSMPSQFDITKMDIGGESVDLGGFNQYVHRRDVARKTEFGVSVKAQDLKGGYQSLLKSSKEITAIIRVGVEQEEIKIKQSWAESKGISLEDIKDPSKKAPGVQKTVEFPTGVLRAISDPRLEAYDVSIDDEVIAKMSLRKGGIFRLDRVSVNHPFIRGLVENMLLACSSTEKITNEDFDIAQDEINNLLTLLEVKADVLLPYAIALSKKEGAGAGEPSEIQPEYQTKQFMFISKENRSEDLRKAVRLLFPTALQSFLKDLSQKAENILSKVIYLGPLRSYPPRHLAFVSESDPNWKAGGGYLWNVIKRDASVRDRVNEWLSDKKKLSSPYSFRINNLVTTEDASLRVSKLIEGIVEGEAGVMDESPVSLFDLVMQDPSYLTDKTDEALTSMRGVPDPVLVDVRSGTEVSHRDVGIGISQVLPVLVAAYSSKGKILAMEQPEIHLHPGLQAELGDVFIQSTVGDNKNSFILETHSEHLVLRIMRRIRETYENKLPPGMPPIKPEDVSILYVEPDGARSIVREMELNERGDFVKAWPGGFFEESLREVIP